MDILLSRQAWNDQQVIDHFASALDTTFKGVPPRQQKQLFALAQRSAAAQQTLADQLRRLHQDTETIAINLLALELEKKAGQPIDPRTAHLHTRPSQRTPRAADSEQAPDALVSKTLWAAAREGFGFDISHGTGSGLSFIRNSYLTDAEGATLEGLDVTDFVALVRELDLGEQIASNTSTQIKDRLTLPLHDHCQAQIAFDLNHGHCLDNRLLDASGLQALRKTVSDGDQHWAVHALGIGGKQLLIPFFVRTLAVDKGDPVYSYCPHRPGGALRRHPSEQSARDSMLYQIRDSAKAGDLNWLIRQMSLADQQTLMSHLEAPAQGLEDFNWLARHLYAWFADDRPASQRLTLEAHNLEVKSLVQAVQDRQALRFYSDITRLATSNAAIDRRTLTQGLEYVASETLEMLLLPLPGGLLGASKLVMVTLMGTLGYQTVTAILARQNGEAVRFVQAMADIVDLIISARINGVAARLSRQRSRQLLSRLANPVIDAQRQLHWPDPADPTPSLFPEPQPLSAIGLLRKMLPSDVTFTDATLARLLKLGRMSRDGLDAVWSADATTPHDFADLLVAEQLRHEFDAVASALEGDRPLPPLANELVPALLARHIEVPVWIFEAASQDYSGQYAPSQAGAAPKPDLVLTHLGQRRYRSAASVEPAAGSSLFEAVIQAYDPLQPDNDLGKIGDFSVDASLANRAEQLRKQMLAHLNNDMHGLFQQWLARRLLQLSPNAPAPGPQQRAHSSANSAMATLTDPLGRGAPADAAHLSFAMLTTLPGWPVELGVELYAGFIDRNGQLRASDQLLHSYGEPEVETFITFAQLGARHSSVDQNSGDTLQTSAPHHALSELILHTLTDSQRDAIGYTLADAAKLSQTFIDLALLERGDLYVLFPEPVWAQLGETRLKDFDTHLDLSGQPADSQGLHTYGGRLYASVEGRYCQVLHDFDASSPHHPVMRIVRPSDDLAAAPDNRYIPGRPGSSEPIARNGAGEWQGIVTGLVGGMPPKRQGRRVLPAIRGSRREAEQALVEAADFTSDVDRRLEPTASEMSACDIRVRVNKLLDDRASTALTRANLEQAIAERSTKLPAFLALNHEKVAALDKHAEALDLYDKTILASDTPTRNLYTNEYRGVLIRRISTFDQIMLCDSMMTTGTTERLRDDPSRYPAEFIAHREEYLALMDRTKPIALRREADVHQLRSRLAGGDVEERLGSLETKKPVTSFYVQVAQLQFNIDLMVLGDIQAFTRLDFRPVYLARDFRANATALKTVDEVITHQRIAMLDGIQRQFESMYLRFEALAPEYAQGQAAQRIATVLEIAKAFETMATARLDAELALHQTQDQVSRLVGDLDLDFLPPQQGAAPNPLPRPRKRAIKVRQRGMSAYVVGEVRTEDGTEQVAVIAHDSGAVVQQYQKDTQGQWQRQPDRQVVHEADQRALQAEADRVLVQVPAVGEQALAMNRRHDNPTNIVEWLERHADECLSLAGQLPDKAVALGRAAALLTEQGRTIMIQRYKDPAVLDVHRLLYLIDQHEVTVDYSTQRLVRGKGKNRYYLDVYEIRDVQDGSELWHAHFHYPATDSPKDAYPLRGGHLKTLEQSRLGREHQQRQEQAGVPVERIWRQEIDRNSARKLFALASQG